MITVRPVKSMRRALRKRARPAITAAENLSVLTTSGDMYALRAYNSGFGT
jgi:hypothetical protein